MPATYDLDGKGPVITLTSPKDLSILSGTVALSFTLVDDISGTDVKSISVRLNEVPHLYNETTGAWTVDGQQDHLSFRFGRHRRDRIAQINVSISGKDNVGNPTDVKTATFYWDEQPPIISLTPPLFRAVKRLGNTEYCSHAFNPTGISNTRRRGG